MNRQLKWVEAPWYGNPDMGMALYAVVGRGRLWLHTFSATAGGIAYTSSFGANSDKSFTGYLLGMTVEQAQLAVLEEAGLHWG